MLTTLPRPLNQREGASAYQIGDVWGQQPGSKKRKRSELAVGIDGEALNLYDVSFWAASSPPSPKIADLTSSRCHPRG